ncbi:phiSA1p31-related protein [Streptomyces umbrinus]|uniref:phiSA1p31-related protein n=1 Tax=Streptomyces umbrinus TaxID=67370 RepID=UPI0034395A5F
MTQTFKVGDKVRHDGRGEVEITYGPFRGQFIASGYVAKQGDGVEVFVDADLISAIPEAPKFAIGDKVRSSMPRREGKLVAGPFTSHIGAPFWVLEDSDGAHSSPREQVLTKLVEPQPIKVGDRVRVTDDDGGGTHRFVGVVGTVKELNGETSVLPYLVEFGDGRGRHGELNGRWNCRTVERVTDEATTYIYNDITYELGVTYSDNDGDRWTFERHEDEIPMSTAGSFSQGSKLSDVVEDFGPLSRV